MKMTFEQARPEICAWLTAHGIEPNDVPYAAQPKIQPDGSVWLPLYENPKRLTADDEIAMTETTVTPVGDLPAVVTAWVNGDFPPLGAPSGGPTGGTPNG